MTGRKPTISVIIPTHNRRESVCRTLAALATQTMPPARFETIVVADGCVDDTVSYLRSLTLPFRLTVVEQPGQGQGKARNEGTARAAGNILVFLDDDIEPHAGMLAAYEQAHGLYPRHLIIGPAPPVLTAESSFFHHGLRNWWLDHIQSLKQVSHRFTYRDMHSGNFSMATDLFAETNGFDSEFFGRSGEDYEFGIRLLAMGVPYTLAAEAAGFHHDGTDLDRSLLRVRMEGRADVLIGLRHPELRTGLRLAGIQSSRTRLLRLLLNLAFNRPSLGDWIARFFRVALQPLERFRLRRTWRAVYGAVRSYWYCRGAAEELRSSAPTISAADFCQGGSGAQEPIPDFDLDGGLDHAKRALDALRPSGVNLRLGGLYLGEVAPIPGAEPLRGDHLPTILAGQVYYRLLAALAMNEMRTGKGWKHFFAAGEDRTRALPQ